MAKREQGGKKRSEVLSVRLDPRLKYLAELGARANHQTLSGFVEKAVEAALLQVHLDHRGGVRPLLTADLEHQLWDLGEEERLVRLALHYPHLLALEEQKMWKAIRENNFFWRGRIEGRRGTSPAHEDAVRYDRLRTYWKDVRAVGAGELTAEALAERAVT